MTVDRAEIKAIYQTLGDDLSKRIYRQRLLYSLLRDKVVITDMVRFCCPSAKWLDSEKLCYYGAGAAASWIIRCCDRRSFVIDRYKRGAVEGLPIISIDEFMLRPDCRDYTIVVTVGKESLQKEIAEELDAHDLRYLFAYFGTQYFDLPELALDNEAFVDAGALDGETSRYFLDHYGGHSYLFEPSPEQFSLTGTNMSSYSDMELFSCGLYDKDGTVRFSPNAEDAGSARVSDEGELVIPVARLDHVLDGRRVTFIKMDIEGSELAALRGAEKTIRAQRPKLAICVYHKPEDIWEIPAYILSLNPDYRLYLRHYSITDTETVLYAIP